MRTEPFTPFLRRVLLLDAATCALMGAALLAAGAALEEILLVPAGVCRAAGVVLLGFAAAVGYVGTRESPSPPAVRAIVASNALWAIASILALVLGWLEPNPFGRAFVVAQAAAAGVIAGLQHVGLRRDLRIAQ